MTSEPSTLDQNTSNRPPSHVNLLDKPQGLGSMRNSFACLVDWSGDWFDLILDCLLLRQLRDNANVMQWVMICYDLIWKCMYNDRCKFEVLQLPLFNQLGTRTDDSNGCQTFRVNRDWIQKNRRNLHRLDIIQECLSGSAKKQSWKKNPSGTEKRNRPEYRNRNVDLDTKINGNTGITNVWAP